MTRSRNTSKSVKPRHIGKFADRDRQAEALFDRLVELEPDDPARAPLIDEITRLHLDLCDGLAARYTGRSIPREDLVQVARLALVVAIGRYRPGPGTSFVGYALPTISGELKRHFRDHGWMVRPPRRLQELGPVLRTTRERWQQDHGTEPTTDELAGILDLPVSDVGECLAAEQSYHPLSLDITFDEDDSRPLADQLAEPHHALESAVDRVCLAHALRQLSPKDLKLLHMRFVEDRTQKEIGLALGVSQMQVSRLVRSVLSRLRTLMGVPEPDLPVAV